MKHCLPSTLVKSRKENPKKEIMQLQNEMDTMEKRQTELTVLFKRLYEDSVLGRISDEQYQMLSHGYGEEQAEINKRKLVVEGRIKELNESSANVSGFLEKARKHKEIRIYYRDVGLLDDMPLTAPSARSTV